MRTFDVVFYSKKHKRNLAYRKLDGRKAIKLMEDLISKGYNPEAVTEANNITEGITLTQMREAVL